MARAPDRGYAGPVDLAAPVDVFAYRDYRAFLRAYYEHRKSVSDAFSYRSFARRAGLRSPNYLKLVIDGARNLSPTAAPRFADACGLAGDSKEFFCELVAFGAARADEQHARYARLTSFIEYQSAHKLEVAHAVYVSTWYIPAIRELVLHKSFRPDPEWIAAHMRPRIKPAEARHAIAILRELGFLVERGGTLAQRDAVVSTGPEVSGLHFAKYHREMMDRAAQALASVPADERDISAITVCVSKPTQQRIKQRIRQFRKELLAMAEQDAQPDRVLQINFQLFPLAGGDACER